MSLFLCIGRTVVTVVENLTYRQACVHTPKQRKTGKTHHKGQMLQTTLIPVILLRTSKTLNSSAFEKKMLVHFADL